MHLTNKQEILNQQNKLIDKIKYQSEELKLVIDKILSYMYNNFDLFKCNKCSDFNYVISDINQTGDSILLICRKHPCLFKVWVKLKNSNFIVKDLKNAYDKQKILSDLLDESNDEYGQFLKNHYGEYYQRKGTYGDKDYKISDLYNYDDVSLLILNDYNLINTEPHIDDIS